MNTLIWENFHQHFKYFLKRDWFSLEQSWKIEETGDKWIAKTQDLWDPKTSIGVRASNNENSLSENDDYPLRASKVKDLRHPAKPFFQNESDVNGTIHSKEESDVEDYHMVTGASRQLSHRQILQNPHYQGDMTGSHGDKNISTSLEKQPNPNNQNSIALKKMGNKNPQPLYFHQKTTTLPPSSYHKTVREPSGTNPYINHQLSVRNEYFDLGEFQSTIQIFLETRLIFAWAMLENRRNGRQMNCKTQDLWDPKTMSKGVRASNNENSHSENDDYPFRASKMKDLRHPAKPFFQNESDVNVTIHSNEESDVEEYHIVTGASRQLRRQISQNPHYQSDMTGSHGDQNTSTSLEKQLNPNNQISIALKKMGNKNPQPLYFHQKTTTLPPSSYHKTVRKPSGTNPYINHQLSVRNEYFDLGEFQSTFQIFLETRLIFAWAMLENRRNGRQMNCKTQDLWDPKTMSKGVRASNNENSHSENDDYPFRASKMKDLRHPAKPFFQNESDVNVTIHSNEESDVEDYHSCVYYTCVLKVSCVSPISSTCPLLQVHNPSHSKMDFFKKSEFFPFLCKHFFDFQ